MMEKTQVFKVGINWEEVEIISEPYVVFTQRGYIPAVDVRLESQDLARIYISARSLSEHLEEMKKNNSGTFTGLKFRLKKQSEERFSPYVVEAA